MVNYPTKTVYTDFISNFTTGNSISVQADMTTSNLTVLGTLITSNFVSSNSNLFVWIQLNHKAGHWDNSNCEKTGV